MAIFRDSRHFDPKKWNKLSFHICLVIFQVNLVPINAQKDSKKTCVNKMSRVLRVITVIVEYIAI